jgi:hypothetical protein
MEVSVIGVEAILAWSGVFFGVGTVFALTLCGSSGRR